MSISAPASIPSPTSPSRTSVLAAPTSTPAVGNRHPSRPSFTVGYAPPAPLHRVASPNTSNETHLGPDPRSSAEGARFIKRPHQSSSASPNLVASASSNTVVANQLPKPFVAPAHPQSHHLHTLPPREKTTRTLILDHTAWCHGRTRFAQGRCELGMKVRFKTEEQASNAPKAGSSKRPGIYIGSGPPSQPANYSGGPPQVELVSSDDEGEAKDSDCESVKALTYGRRSKQPTRNGEREVVRVDDRTDVDIENGSAVGGNGDLEPSATGSPAKLHNFLLAPELAARATGIEKVIHAMLAQPPSSPPRSPSPPSYAMQNSHYHTQHSVPPPPPAADAVSLLPNGLRLRLALLGLVNDLFERQPPPSQEDEFLSPSQAFRKPNSNSPELFTALPPPTIPPQHFPSSGLDVLTEISSQPFYAQITLPSFHTLTVPSSSSVASNIPTLSPTGHGPSVPTSPGPADSSSWILSTAASQASGDCTQSSPQTQRPPPPLFTWPRSNGGATSSSSAVQLGSPTQEKDPERNLLAPTFTPAQGSPTSRPLPSSWKGSPPKHLPDKSSISGPSGGLVKTARGRSRELFQAGCYAIPSSTSSFRSNAATYTSGTGVTPTSTSGYPLKKLKTLCPRHLREMCRICVSSVVKRGVPSTQIGAGLLSKKGCLDSGSAGNIHSTRYSGCVLADLIPRFLRLSALVAMELTREARGEEPETNAGQADDKAARIPSASPLSVTSKTSSYAQPTRTWFALLCGLLTRAALEGYVARGWKGDEHAEVLLGVGLGLKGVGTRGRSTMTTVNSNAPAPEVVSAAKQDGGFEPDEMPCLIGACKVLFNGLVQDASTPPGSNEKATRIAEAEYVAEMEERLSEFLTVPHAIPDLATHLIQLSEKYPAEPVERAALRFCEAVAKWRGKPELEMYKKMPMHHSATKSHPSTPAPLSITALLTSAPTTPAPLRRPPIEKYFRVLSSQSAGSLSSTSSSSSSSSSRNRQPPDVAQPQPQRALKRQRSFDEEDRDSHERQQQPKREKVDAMGVDMEKGTEDEAVQEDSEWVGPYGV